MQTQLVVSTVLKSVFWWSDWDTLCTVKKITLIKMMVYSHRPLDSIQLCLVVTRPSLSSCSWSYCPHFLLPFPGAPGSPSSSGNALITSSQCVTKPVSFFFFVASTLALCQVLSKFMLNILSGHCIIIISVRVISVINAVWSGGMEVFFCCPELIDSLTEFSAY